MVSLKKLWIRSSDTLASRIPLRTQGKELSGRINIPTRASVVKTCRTAETKSEALVVASLVKHGFVQTA